MLARSMSELFPLLLGLALVFDFLNGFHDSSNIVATVISSRAMRPRAALLLAALAEFAGPFLFGVAVATTVGAELLDPANYALRAVRPIFTGFVTKPAPCCARFSKPGTR